MAKAKQLIKELESELNKYTIQSKNFDLDKVDDAKLVFSRMAFYQAQAFKKVFERLDEIETLIEERDNRRISTKIYEENRRLKAAYDKR